MSFRCGKYINSDVSFSFVLARVYMLSGKKQIYYENPSFVGYFVLFIDNLWSS